MWKFLDGCCWQSVSAIAVFVSASNMTISAADLVPEYWNQIVQWPKLQFIAAKAYGLWIKQFFQIIIHTNYTYIHSKYVIIREGHIVVEWILLQVFFFTRILISRSLVSLDHRANILAIVEVPSKLLLSIIPATKILLACIWPMMLRSRFLRVIIHTLFTF